MLQRKFLSILLPVVTLGVVVGSGFSAWYFDDTNIGAKDINVNVQITDKVTTVGTLEFLTRQDQLPTKVILDQGGYANKEDVTKGISFDKTEIKAQFKFINEAEFNRLNAAGMHVAVTQKITLDKTFATYVDLVTPGDFGTREENTNHVTYTKIVPLKTYEANYDYTINLSSSNEANVFLKYIEGQKPQNATDYGKMVTALTNITSAVSFNWSVAVVQNA